MKERDGVQGENQKAAHEDAKTGKERKGSGDRWRIGVMGLSPGAGASLITACLAAFLAEEGKGTVAVAELGTGGLYDSLGMAGRFALREFHSFYKAVKGDVNLRRVKNEEGGINWALKRPEERGEILDYRPALRLIYGISGDVALFDFSGRADEEAWRLLREMDVALSVIDPMPSRLMANYGTLERWKLSGLPIRYIINKDNRGIGKKELDRFLRLKTAARIPFLDPELLYAAEFNGKNPYRMEGLRIILEPVFRQVLEGAFPDC